MELSEMSLQTKVGGLVLAVFLAYGALDYGVQRLVILPSFQLLERQEAQKNMDRAVQAIEREISHLSTTATDWATWDDTYRFIVDHNDAFREENLNAKALENLKVDLLYLVDTGRRPVWGMVYDQRAGEEITLPELAGDRLAAGHPLLALPQTDSEVRGVMATARGPLLVAARPIVTSAGAGPVRGSMVIGLFLDPAAIAEQARVKLAALAIAGEPLPPEETAVVGELGDTGESIIHDGGTVDRVYRVLPDIYGRPALLLRVDVPKAISAQGQGAIRYAQMSLLVAGLLILVILLIGLRYLVLKPLSRLTSHAVSVGQRGDLTARLSLVRQDEIGMLAREFDRMVERLADARKRLVDQSFQAGIAELASGVLHNIGNAITPLKVRVATLSETFRQTPTADLQMALAELAGGKVPPERRRDLEQFAELAGREVATVVDKGIEQLAGIDRQVEHVHKVLVDQERFSRAARVMEAVPVDELVRESAGLLDDGLRRTLRLELDAGLPAAGAALGSRAALQQILLNLLKNAAEAIGENSPSPDGGRIAVDASTELSDGQPVVHLRVMDNGMGIRPEDLPHIFERGFSTKSRASSGLGLHWCAVTVTAMGGKLSAESSGVGQGACLHLLLPQVELQHSPLAASARG
jgi:two-component system, NtrC family, sensor kinase